MNSLDSPPDLARRFGSLSRLYGPEAPARLQNSHVAVAGLGGVGSWTVEALARSAANLAEARAALSEARARHAELDAAVSDHEAQASVHRARQESLTTLRAEVDRLEAAGRVRAIGQTRARRWLAPPLTGFTTILLLPAALPAA